MKECQKPDDGELVVPVPPDAPAAPASHRQAARRTVDGWDAADAIAEWSDLGALRPASSSQSWPADHRHSDDADEWLSNLPALHGELDEAAP
jgi:hypothetical protein